MIPIAPRRKQRHQFFKPLAVLFVKAGHERTVNIEHAGYGAIDTDWNDDF